MSFKGFPVQRGADGVWFDQTLMAIIETNLINNTLRVGGFFLLQKNPFGAKLKV